jgi:hypothetical protein
MSNILLNAHYDVVSQAIMTVYTAIHGIKGTLAILNNVLWHMNNVARELTNLKNVTKFSKGKM